VRKGIQTYALFTKAKKGLIDNELAEATGGSNTLETGNNTAIEIENIPQQH